MCFIRNAVLNSRLHGVMGCLVCTNGLFRCVVMQNKFCGGMLPKLFAKSRMSILTARIDGIVCRECEEDGESSDKD